MIILKAIFHPKQSLEDCKFINQLSTYYYDLNCLNMDHLNSMIFSYQKTLFYLFHFLLFNLIFSSEIQAAQLNSFFQ